MRLFKLLTKVNGSTPANWVPCEPIIVAPPTTFAGIQKRNEEIAKNRNGMSWYLSFKNPDKCISADMDQGCRKLNDGKNN